MVKTPDRMTVDELARRAGLTVRNVRSYQTRGLLPPPVLEGRTGYYDAGHLGRLRRIQELLERGFSLASLKELLDARADGTKSLSDVLDQLTAPWGETKSYPISREALRQLLGIGEDDRLLRRAIDLGILAEDEDGGLRVLNGALLENGIALAQAGVPVAVTMDELAALRTRMRAVAQRFVSLFVRHVWTPYVKAGMPAEKLPAIMEALERLRPATKLSVDTVLAEAMEREIAAAVAEHVQAPKHARRRSHK